MLGASGLPEFEVDHDVASNAAVIPREKTRHADRRKVTKRLRAGGQDQASPLLAGNED
jgi:hypothetical protein